MIPVDAKVDLCDAGHQAIAFVGTCPLCRMKHRDPALGWPRPLEQGRDTIISELDRVLQEHYSPARTALAQALISLTDRTADCRCGNITLLDEDTNLLRSAATLLSGGK